MWKNILSILLVTFAACVVLDEELNHYALYYALPAAFLINFVYYKIPTKGNVYFKLFLILLGWIFFTYLGAEDLDLASQQLKQLLGVFLVSYTFVSLSYQKKMYPFLYFTYILLLFFAVKYAQEHILSQFYDTGRDRMNDGELNANKMAYYTFYDTFALFIFGEMTKIDILRKILKPLFFVMIPVTFYVAIYTASRQVLIIQIPFIAFLLYMRYIKDQSKKRKILAVLALAAVSFYFMNTINQIYENSYLKQRTEIELERDSRPRLIMRALEVGKEHPVMGVGPGNFILYEPSKRFSHCTYSELFANTGLPGAALFIAMVTILIVRQLKRYRKTHDKMYLYFLTFAVMFAFYQLLYVFYIDMWLMAFFLLVATHSELYYLKTRRKVKKKLACKSLTPSQKMDLRKIGNQTKETRQSNSLNNYNLV